MGGARLTEGRKEDSAEEPITPVAEQGRQEDLDTARLVTRFQAGDEAAFTAIYNRYFDRVFAYLRLLLQSEADAADAAQQVFLSAFEALPTYELRAAAPFRAWLFRIARNHALTQLGKLGRAVPEEPERLNRRRERHPAPTAPPFALTWIPDSGLTTLIERLPLAQRQVLALRFLLDLDHAQIAAILNRTPGDVRSIQTRALNFLRRRLISLSGEPPSTDSAQMQRVPRRAVTTRARRWALTSR